MRYFIALALCFLLISPQVHACQGVSSHATIFFATVPDPQPDADVIAKVSLSEVNNANPLDVTATAKVMQVIKTSDARVRQGSIIPVKVRESTCGPWLKNGDEGIIIARVGDIEGRFVLCPYEHSFGGKFWPQSLSECDPAKIEAVRRVKLAAEQGDPEAQTNLGVMYETGRSVRKDYAKAAQWYRLAAEQGHAKAQVHLGVMYFRGEGVKQSDAEAIKWVTRAAEQGDEDAKFYLRGLRQAGEPDK